MGWWYKPPQSWPIIYVQALRDVAERPNELLPIGSFQNETKAKALAAQHSYFRWCIREKPEAWSELTIILETYDVRTKLKQDEVGYVLYLIAKPTKLSEFINLNPDLAAEILPNCQ